MQESTQLIDPLIILTIYLKNVGFVETCYHKEFLKQIQHEYMQLPKQSKTMVIAEYIPIGLELFMSL